jgi:hypothetical protein
MRVTRSSAPGQSELFQHISILRSMSAALAKQFAAILLIGARYPARPWSDGGDQWA